MKKINFSRRTLVFAFLTIALTAYVYLYEYKTPIEDAISQGKILKFPPEQITYFQLVKPNTKMALQKDETGWRLTEPIFENADNLKVEDFLSSLSEERQETVVKRTESQFTEIELSEFGLDKPEVVFNFKNNSGAMQKIAVGSIKNFEGLSYIQIDSGNKIYLASPTWFSRAQDPLIEYRDKRLFRENLANVKRIKISSLQDTFEIKRVDNKWVPATQDYILDQAIVRDTLKKMAESNIEEYVFEGEPSLTLLKEKQLESAPVTIEFFTDESSWLAKINISTKDNGLYVLSDRPTYLAKADPIIWEVAATLTLDKLRDRSSAFVFNAEEIKKIFYKNNDNETNIIFNSGNWLVGSNTSPYLEVESNELAKAIRKIRDLKVSAFIDTDVRDKFTGQNMLILKTATEKLLLQLNWGPSYIVNKNGVDIEYFYARTQLSDKIFGLEKSVIDDLSLNPDKLTKKSDSTEVVKPPTAAPTEN